MNTSLYYDLYSIHTFIYVLIHRPIHVFVQLSISGGEGEVARAFADDTAVVVSDYSKSLGTIASLFQEFESISGLELNIKKLYLSHFGRLLA